MSSTGEREKQGKMMRDLQRYQQLWFIHSLYYFTLATMTWETYENYACLLFKIKQQLVKFTQQKKNHERGKDAELESKRCTFISGNGYFYIMPTLSK